ncbi:uncharacterized protein SCHCODRAFT_02637381 [Schizophyllum commune H4-8]|uniref:uncharacterized protein n=1 Tax=Schizophyllum commune (strain H4-8 / FGSC 9210) TaxID=578458 RepID=UPI00215DF5D5|nr:uncharacterized protein SCHCODRAFT_02637381 [Schizophyllum commune H4-8]KAI5888679.1 hypothetical protein SCHCODRAFT_02637381 [Schizophyllum commune H4-8]
MQHPPYGPPPDKDNRKIYYTASCHCKRVKYAILTDEPMEAKFCHCTDCHKLFGSPAQWTAMLEKTDVHFLSGVDNLAFYHLADSSHERKLPCKIACRTCRSPVMDEGRKILVIYPSLIDFDELPVGEGEEGHDGATATEGKGSSKTEGGKGGMKTNEGKASTPSDPGESQLILKGEEGELALGKRKRGATSTKGGLTPEEGKKKFFPTCHIFYEQRVDDYVDGKPKYKGHKEEGETIPEHKW